jgi:hypothetical protein
MAELAPSAIMFELAGRPAQDGAVDVAPETRCRVCGHACGGRALAYDRWQNSGFTDQNKLRDWSSSVVCEACVWCHSWSPPPGFVMTAEMQEKKAASRASKAAEAAARGRKLGDERTTNLRLYSHFWHEGEYRYINKGDKRSIRDWLRTSKQGRWFAGIADTGQKHVVPWIPMNFGGPGDLPARGTVRFEETNVRLGSFALVDAMCALLSAGATKEEIENGQYTARAYQLARTQLQAFESDYGRASRGSGWFALALWLSQRDEEQVATRMADEKTAREEKKKNADARPKGRTARPDKGLPTERKSRVPGKRGKSTETLVAAGGRDEASHNVDREREPVGDCGAAKDPTGSWKQGSLFDS